MQTPMNSYFQTKVQTASPAQLLILLYDGAIRFCRLGIEAIRGRKYDQANENLLKAQDIVRELAVTLDRRAEISKDLLRLYDYFMERLREANLKKAEEPAEEILGYLVELRETWVRAEAIQRKAGAARHG
jgi:flagellar protein FliS